MRKKRERRAALLLAAVTMTIELIVPASAAAPAVSVDETMYVNLDYYGKETQINVVKGCSPNGNAQYTDYGTYEKLVNMTDKTEPTVGEGTVTWQLPGNNKRFYYQGTLAADQVELPWTFDVSYKLNGVETAAEQLAGASGLVEIHVKADPNPAARAYYRNNMLLTVLVPVDMEDCYSVDAPGSQLQSMGSMSAVMFAALPGEEGDFTVRIGSDSFESVGVVMMMVPGTLEALDNIKDIKEIKDTWRENGDQLYDSMDALLASMEMMKEDVSRVSSGLGDLDQARGQVSQNRKQIEALSTQAIAALGSVTEQTAVIIPYMEVARNAVSEINMNLDAMYNTMEDMQDELDRLYDRLKGLKNALNSAADQLEQGGISAEDQKRLSDTITAGTEEAEEILDAIEELLGSGASLSGLSTDQLDALEEVFDQADSFRFNRGRAAKSEDNSADDGAEAASGTVEGGTAETGAGVANQAEETEEASPSDADMTAFGTEEAAFSQEDAGSAEGTSAGETDPDTADSEETQNAAQEELEALLRRGPSGRLGTGGVNEEDFEAWSEEMDEYADEIEEALQSLAGTGYAGQVADILEEFDGILGSSSSFQQSAAETIGRINGAFATLGNVSSKTASTVSVMRTLTDEMINLLDDARVLIDTTDRYVPSMLDSLTDTEELLRRLTGALGSTHSLLSLVNDTAVSAGDSLDAGTRESLQGLQKMMEKSVTMLDDVTAIRNASRNMKATLDDKLDEMEEENNFLNLDPEADMISFTSAKNPSPHSLQIVLRTDEISIDDDATDISDLEAVSTDAMTPLQRMWRVIVEIFRAIAEIFKNR